MPFHFHRLVSWYCCLVIFLSKARSCTTFATPRLTHPCSLLRRFNSADANDSKKSLGGDFTIEKVSNRSRTLDVSVFRSFSITAADYQQQRLEEHGETISEHEAIQRLTPGITKDGRDTRILGGPLVTFVAITNQQGQFDRTHGVVGAVDAKLNNDHVYLKNLHVDDRVRRRGLASALVLAVKQYTQSSPVNQIVLHVLRPSNENAIALYEKEGFEFQEELDGDGRMIFSLESDD